MNNMEVKNDEQILQFNYNQPKDLASLSFNTVNQQHTPLGYDKIESTPASGNYFKSRESKTFLGPAPRSQLGVPTSKVYRGDRKKFYKPVMSNGNFVRGNDFGLISPYKMADEYNEIVSIPTVDPIEKGSVDYLGNDAKVVIRNNDPFYPYPGQHLLKNKNYWAYAHENKYLNDQPIYNYGHGNMEGGDRGRYDGGKGYDAYEVENFCCGKKDGGEVVEGFEGGRNIILLVVVIFIMILLFLGVRILKK